MQIRESPYFGIFYTAYNMISVEHRHVYQIIILTMIRSMVTLLWLDHMLNNLLIVAQYGNFL